MQRNEIKAFRQRLVRAGFTDICIFDCGNDYYSVSCLSSSGRSINKVMSIYQINNTPRLFWFD